MRDENKDALIAFGASSLATGISILILEQLRNSTTGYKFQAPIGWQPAQVPIIPQHQMAQQYTSPVGQVVKEI